MGESWAASAREPPALNTSVFPELVKQERGEGGVGRERSGERAEPLTLAHRPLKSFFLSEGRRTGSRGWGAAQGALPRRTRPQTQAPGYFWGRLLPEGLRAELSKAREASGLTMTLRSASDASADARAGRPPAPDAGSPTGLRSPDAGRRFRAPRGSSSHFQPCGCRTRRSCCNQSQDRPIVLARSRLLSPGSARPGRS